MICSLLPWAWEKMSASRFLEVASTVFWANCAQTFSVSRRARSAHHAVITVTRVPNRAAIQNAEVTSLPP